MSACEKSDAWRGRERVEKLLQLVPKRLQRTPSDLADENDLFELGKAGESAARDSFVTPAGEVVC
ncbi:MAG: hypothetical protein QM790_13370 [Nibricoccus sp.]